jgi:hypothetical protein
MAGDDFHMRDIPALIDHAIQNDHALNFRFFCQD